MTEDLRLLSEEDLLTRIALVTPENCATPENLALLREGIRRDEEEI